MRIIINEHQESLLLQQALVEEYNYIDTQKEIVKKWLNQHFKPMDYEASDDYGYPTRKCGLCLLDSYGQPSETLLTWEDGIDRLETQFKKMVTDPTKRKTFLVSVLKDWWSGK